MAFAKLTINKALNSRHSPPQLRYPPPSSESPLDGADARAAGGMYSWTYENL